MSAEERNRAEAKWLPIWLPVALCAALLLTGCSEERYALAKACKDAGGYWLGEGSWAWPDAPDASCLFLIVPRITYDTARAVVEDTTGGRR